MMVEGRDNLAGRLVSFLALVAVFTCFILIMCLGQEMKARPTLRDVSEAFRQRDEIMHGIMQRVLKTEKDLSDEKGTN